MTTRGGRETQSRARPLHFAAGFFPVKWCTWVRRPKNPPLCRPAKWLGTINAVVILKITAKSARLNFKANKINKLCLCVLRYCERQVMLREMPTFYCTLGSWYLCALAIKSTDFETYLMLAWLSLQLLADFSAKSCSGAADWKERSGCTCSFHNIQHTARKRGSRGQPYIFVRAYVERFVLLGRQERGCGSIKLFHKNLFGPQ